MAMCGKFEAGELFQIKVEKKTLNGYFCIEEP
jgi:hypothetical protein